MTRAATEPGTVRPAQVAAYASALLWAWATLFSPLQHVAFHGALAAHTHGPERESSALATTTETPHCHGRVCHGDTRDDGPRYDARHGAHSLEHFAVALQVPPPALPPVPASPLTRTPLEQQLVSAPGTAPGVAPVARGPPTLSA